MKKINAIVLMAFLALLSSCRQGQKENVSNVISLKSGDTEQMIIEKASRVVPSKRQYEWQKDEFIAFLHFGVNTFNGVEWGNGKESPTDFNPSSLDARQWVKVMKSGGMKLAMITAKHHDGFCLWPSRYTEHSVKNSPWKNGKGDVVKELSEACKEGGLKLGIYLSPADLHEIEAETGRYGNGSKPRRVTIPSDYKERGVKNTFEYDSLTDYDVYFMNQLYELLTEYGPVHEVWFDGANPKPGTGQTYNYTAWYDMIRKLRPEANIAIKGPDVRWCGNEAGRTRKTEWSIIPFVNGERGSSMPDDLGSRKKLLNDKVTSLRWSPAETNTSIRHGWFYRDEQQYVKTKEEILDVWFKSVGGNSVFLLNLTPDKRGLIPDKDAAVMKQVGDYIAASFRTNLCKSKKELLASASPEQHPASHAFDGNPDTYWLADKTPADLVINFDSPQRFNCLVMQEAIHKKGQRIEKFAFDVWNGNKWEKVFEGTTVGYKKIKRFPQIKAQKVRVRILESRNKPSLSFVGLYKSVEIIAAPVISRKKSGEIVINCSSDQAEIHYTLDGSEPTMKSPRYKKPMSQKGKANVKAVSFVDGGATASDVVEERYDIPKTKWKVLNALAQKGFGAEKLIDGDFRTIWHSPWDKGKQSIPQQVAVDLGEELKLKGFTYVPRTDGKITGVCKKYSFMTSLDGKKWKTQVSKAEFGNIKHNPMKQEVFFKKSTRARYIKFVAHKEVTGKKFISGAELGVITE